MALSCSDCSCCSLALLVELCGCLAGVNDGLGVGIWGCLSCVVLNMWHHSVCTCCTSCSRVLLFFSFHSCSMCGLSVCMLCTFCSASCYPSGLWSRCHWNRWIGYLGCDQHFMAKSFGVLCDLSEQSERSRCSLDPGYFGNLHLKCSLDFAVPRL